MRKIKGSVFVLTVVTTMLLTTFCAMAATVHVSTFEQLRAAVNDAAGQTDIIVDNDILFTETITVPNSKDITIQSAVNDPVTLLTTEAAVRHFHVAVAAAVTFENITLDGSGVGGGVLHSGGELTVADGALITGCFNQTGGGLYSDYSGGAPIVVDGGKISGNSATWGGGIMGGSVIVRDGEISGNSALWGGGISAETVIVEGGKISGNTGNSVGGGIDAVNITVNGGEISGNTAMFGGGIGNDTVGGTITINGGKISGNTSTSLGGGIYSANGSTTAVNGGEISGNTALTLGGGIYSKELSALTVSADVFSGNSATRAYWMSDPADIALYGAQVINVTRFSEPPAGNPPFEYAYNNYDISYEKGQAEVFTVTFVDWDGTVLSTQTVDYGAAATAPEDPSRENHIFTGWDLDFSAVKSALTVTAQYITTATVHVSTFEQLRAAVNDAAGQTYIIVDNDILFTETITVPNFKDITIQSAANAPVTLLTTEAAVRHFHVAVAAAVTFENITLDGSGVGGGVLLSGVVTVADGALITGCFDHTGGGLYSDYSGGATVVVDGGKISGNSATWGGGMMVENVIVKDGEISGNTASWGGGISAETVTVEGGKINGNTGNVVGGGIDAVNIIVNGGEISGNTGLFGGGIGNDADGGAITINGGKISDNTSTSRGGGIYGYGSTITVNGGEISGNAAFELGGGIYSKELSALTVSADVFSGNSATRAYWMSDPADIALYGAQVKNVTRFSEPPAGNPPFEYAYNNYDISYEKGQAEVFTVTFVDWDGTVLSTQTVDYGAAATAPEDPSRENHIFTGWDLDFSAVKGALTVTAQYKYKPFVSSEFNNGVLTLYNHSDEIIEGMAIISIYHLNGSMAATEPAPFYILPGESTDVIFKIDLDAYPADQYIIKVFAWDNETVPVTTAIEQ